MSENKPPALPHQETANIHLRWQETERVFPIPIPPRESTLLDLLPAARELSNQATALALEQTAAQGKTISCRDGCAACCRRQLVVISVVEALALAELVARMPPERQALLRQRFADAVHRLETAGLLDASDPKGDRSLLAQDLGERAITLEAVGQRYFQLEIPCPFLENDSCSIHPQRPMVCREHHVTTPAENCARLYQVNVDRVEPPVRLGEVLARTTHRVGAGDTFMIPLVLSLEWSEVHGPDLKKMHDGMTLFQTMMSEMEVH